MIALEILFGLATGFAFGYILTRTGITKYWRVMGMLLLKDFKILKFMLTAVTCSMVLFYLFGDAGLLVLSPKSLDWGKVVGGLLFGTGMGLLGYCPGTMAARIGEGKKEAVVAFFGMALGILLYAMAISPLKGTLLAHEMSGNVAALLHVNHWVVVLPAALLFSGIVFAIHRKVSDEPRIL